MHDGRIGVLVELGMQSDFTARMDEVQEFLKDVAMHIAAQSPENIADLLGQSFVKEPALTVGELPSRLSQELREDIEVRRFVRWDTEWKAPEQDTPPRDPATAMRLKAVK